MPKTPWSAMDSSNDKNLALMATDVNRYYEQVVALYWHELKTFLMCRVGNPQDAEDIVQDVFVRAYTALRRYSVSQRQELKIRAWLYKIAWNVYFTYMSRSKASTLIPLDLSPEGEWLDHEEEQGPELAYEQGEQRQELETLVSTLPRHYRVVVSLYYFDGLNYQEIANLLKQPVGTVKVYVHRGVRLLRKALALQMSEVGCSDGLLR
jgi:RNA polymerase sigma-70 factor (ECF subfamily)